MPDVVTVTKSELFRIARGEAPEKIALSPEFYIQDVDVMVIQRYPVDEILLEDERVASVIARDIAYAVARWLDIHKDLIPQTKKLIVRPAVAKEDMYYPDETWRLSIDGTGWVDLATLNYETSTNEMDKKLILIRGFVIVESDPVVRLLRFVRRGDYSAPVDVYAHRNVKGWLLLRKRVVVAKDSLTIQGYATSTGTVTIVGKFCIVVEPEKTQPFVATNVEEEKY